MHTFVVAHSIGRLFLCLQIPLDVLARNRAAKEKELCHRKASLRYGSWELFQIKGALRVFGHVEI